MFDGVLRNMRNRKQVVDAYPIHSNSVTRRKIAAAEQSPDRFHFADIAARHGKAWTNETVLTSYSWTPSLFSIRISRDSDFTFSPGQFARIGLCVSGEAVSWRPFSIVSAPWDAYLEFHFAVLPASAFTSQLSLLQPGNQIMVSTRSEGSLSPDRFVAGKDLWMIAGGTGLAPFLSILRDQGIWEQYENLIVVHSVRRAEELTYADEIAEIRRNAAKSGSRAKLHYIPVTTRENRPGALSGRITQLIADGILEAHAGIPFDTERSRIMICASSEMIFHLRQLLIRRGFQISYPGSAGQLLFEDY